MTLLLAWKGKDRQQWMCAAVVPEPRPLKFAPTVMVLAAGLITTTAAPVPAEPVGGTSFEPTSWVTNRSCACEAGTNRHAAPMKARSSEAHLIAVARRKQFMSSLPTAPWQLCRGSTPKLPLMIVFEIGRSLLVSKSEQFRFQQAVARTPHKLTQPKRLFHLVFESHDGRAEDKREP